MKILIIEDQSRIANHMQFLLEREGHSVTVSPTGNDGFEVARNEAFDLLIVDLMLPGMDGVEIVSRLRSEQISTPIMILTAKGDSLTHERLLNTGADYFMTKPFANNELVATVKAALRRSRSSYSDDMLQLADLSILHQSRSVLVDGDPQDLSAKEYELLTILAGQPGRVFTKDDIFFKIYGNENAVSDNAIEKLVSRLRKVLKQSRVEIRTRRGIGYSLETH